MCLPQDFNRLNRSIGASVIDWLFGLVMCSSRSKRAPAAMNGVEWEGELFVVPQHIRAAMSSGLSALRAATRALRRCAPCSATSQMPSSKTLGARSLAGNGSRPQVSQGRTPARSGAGLPASREDIAHRMVCGNTNTPLPSRKNACQIGRLAIDARTSTTRIKRLAWLIRAARAD